MSGELIVLAGAADENAARLVQATARDDVDELELATLSWVHWFNYDRLHGHCSDSPPAEYETAFYAAQQTCSAGAGNP